MTMLFYCEYKSQSTHNVVRDIMVLNKKHNLGLDVNKLDKTGKNCLHVVLARAMESRRVSRPMKISLGILLAAGVDIDCADGDGKTPKAMFESLDEKNKLTKVYKAFQDNKLDGMIDDDDKFRQARSALS
mmetsp:Transcript_23565/g.26140  ORF Transcript_23565/g.26140 Transcript_23565/m.26140 type:complete len:130 (-) Transcript_23565:73-462(-)